MRSLRHGYYSATRLDPEEVRLSAKPGLRETKRRLLFGICSRSCLAYYEDALRLGIGCSSMHGPDSWRPL